MSSQYLTLNHFFDGLLSPFASGAVCTAEGEVIYLKYENLADIGTIGNATRIACQYIKPKMGDVAILNDPYSGGTTLSTMTLVTPLIPADSNTTELYLTIRVGFKPNLTITQNLEEEGVRIPPTPIALKKEINTAILSAIAMHPLCPHDFQKKITDQIQLLFDRVHKATLLHRCKSIDFSKTHIKKYLTASKEVFQNELSEIPHGEYKAETTLDQGEIIRLKIELTEDKVQIDFRGTSISKSVCLTDAATFGACFGAITAFLGKTLPVNSETFSFIQVTTPLGCLLNSKYPSPTFKGMTDGTALIANCVITALSRIVKNRDVAQSAVASSKIQMNFENGQKFYDHLPGGAGAHKTGAGCDGISFWQRNNLQPSIEEIERQFPLLVRRVSLRNASGGKGQFAGGNGMFKMYELLQPAQLSWILDQTKNTPMGINGATRGSSGEIFVYHKEKSEKQNLPDQGQVKLQSRDTISVYSAGGGGWGTVKES